MKVFVATIMLLFIVGCEGTSKSRVEHFNGVEITFPSRGTAVTNSMVLGGELDANQTLILESALNIIIDAVLFVTFERWHAEYSSQFVTSSASLLATNKSVVRTKDTLSYLGKITDWLVDEDHLQFTVYYSFKNTNQNTIDQLGKFYRLPSTFYFERAGVGKDWHFIENVFTAPIAHLR